MAKQGNMELSSGTVEEKKEDRVDEHTLSVLRQLGYQGRLPDSLVRAYKRMKAITNVVYPSRLSAEGFAFIIMLSELSEGTLSLKEAKDKE